MAPMKRPSKDADNAWGETMSIARIAERWRTSRRAVRHLLANGTLRFTQVEGSLRVPRAAVDAYERARRPK
ncbi:MAG: excisionase family DNA-binding protein [Planctomycetia bacterium]|nr:excisionase family DNA-binding protein [Planctomycetia bacterium]